MKKFGKYISFSGVWLALLGMAWDAGPQKKLPKLLPEYKPVVADSVKNKGKDTSKTKVPLKYPFKDESVQDPLNYPNSGGLKMENPANIKTDVDYDPASGNYNITQKMGGLNYRPPTYMEQDEYNDYELNKFVKNYWRQKTGADNVNKTRSVFAPKLHVGGELFDRIFGGNTIDIRPQGSAELIFGTNTSRNQDPRLSEKQRKITTFEFDMKIQLNVIGKIGDKLKLNTNYNTEAGFDFENQMKLGYQGSEDEIIKTIEGGNVSLPLTGSLITGSQSLFGFKTGLQFGRLTATSIFSQQKGKKSEVEVTGGAQTSNFDVDGDSYESYKHFLLSQYFRTKYDQALATLPTISSGINITKIEVWITNKTGTQTDIHNILALTDLGDTARLISKSYTSVNPGATDLPDNKVNNLDPVQLTGAYPGLRNRNLATDILTKSPFNWDNKHFAKLEQARRLSSSEFTINSKLGYISLNQTLNDEILAVAYQYTYNGQIYQVGEFSTDGIKPDSLLIVKMLKSPNISPKTQAPMWDLMMKNVYSIGAYQVNSQDFKLNIIYSNPSTGTDLNYLPVGTSEVNINGKQLIQVMNLDRINTLGDVTPDGVFDFLDGITINANNGRVFFPVLEPFGGHLNSKFIDAAVAKNYAFPELYDSTKTSAQQLPNKNRFKLKGTYKSSSSSEISLNAINVPQGSVKVTAGGVQLQENIDYTVDYTLGRVKIINQGILNSGAPIKISLESNSLFSIQSKTLLGTHLDYKVSKDFTLGATILNLTERPITKKINIGDEPISNTMWGFDGNYRTETPFLTRWIDRLPLISTKAPSSIAVGGEFAQFIPGHSRAIGKGGNAYIDDFEGSQSTIDIKQPIAWSLASTPQGQPSLFPEGSYNNNLVFGYNRAKLAWYTMDRLFLINTSGLTPPGYGNDEWSNHLTREILETEIFPNKQSASGQITPLSTLDLAYYPSERGPYNYDTTGTPGISSGLRANGTLNNPASRWAGIMRRVETNDFEAANIEFLQFWLMDPFNKDNTFGSKTGNLYIDLGDISEDVLRDSRKSYENGLPNSSSVTNVDVTSWGRVPTIQPVNKAFDGTGREFQDVGMDGLRDVDEQSFFNPYLTKLAAQFGTSSEAYQNALRDPSADNYHYYRGDDYDNQNLKTLNRYKQYNGMEGNSATQEQSDNLNSGKYPTQATNSPNEEDINRDNTLNETESYYQYRVSLRPEDFNFIGNKFLTDSFSTSATTLKGAKDIKWYQFKIPVKEFESRIGNIEDFRSIRFIRMFLKDVDTSIVLRFAKLEFVRGEWRKYDYSIVEEGEQGSPDDRSTPFNVAAVNIEENGNRSPVNYVLPPGIDRETNIQSVAQTKLNEQALSLKVCNLKDGYSKAIYKSADLDVRSYKRIKMYVHAEAVEGDVLANNDLSMFIRLGSDFVNNYYEYEIPLNVTPPGHYTAGNETDQKIVWPDANLLDLPFTTLQAIKQARNIALLNNPNITLQTPYTTYDNNNGKNKITIIGNPNLSTVKTIMIGIRNPKNNDQPKCGEIWINEMRLSDFDEKGGWAGNARVTAQLADFGSLSLAGSMSTPGFGSIEKKVSERSRETIKQYDISSSLELGKLLPQSFNLKVPMYVGYSEGLKSPQYNPLDPDILLKDVLPALPKDIRDSIKHVTEDYTRRRSINFTNVKKDKGKNSKKSHIYDIENFTATYSYSEIFMRNINIENNLSKQYRGMLAYNFSASPKNIQPFAKVKFLKSKYLTLIRDFNFTPYPSKYGFTTDINRSYSEIKNRSTTGNDVFIPAAFNKTFNMTRAYDLKYDITKALKLDFTANNDARVMEPQGRIDTPEERDTIKENIKKLGITTGYRHTTNISYTIPINKILPLFDFASASVRYSAGYVFTRSPFTTVDTLALGNTLQNNNAKSLNAQFNMVTLYNKVPYLKRVIQNKPKTPEKKDAKKEDSKKPKTDTKNSKTDSTKTKKTNENNFQPLDFLARLIVSVRNVSATYTNNSGTILPGYADSTRYMGMNPSSDFAPGYGFVFGSQNDIRPEAASKGWLVKNQYLNIPYTTTNAKSLRLQGTAEPFPSFKIDLTANRTEARNYSEFFRWNEISGNFINESPTESGNFSMSFITWKTAFKKDDKDHNSTTFNNFRAYRTTISSLQAQEYQSGTGIMLGQKIIDSTVYSDGYGPLSQDVMIPAFLAAYSGKSPKKSRLNIFPSIPIPNWSISYDGLMKFKFIKKYFKTFTLRHAYRSTYSVGSYANNINFLDIGDGFTNVRDASGDHNFIPQKLIGNVTISEQLSPLIKVDVTWNNSFITNFEIKKDRSISLSTVSAQLTEVANQELVIGSGYRLKDVSIGKLKIKGKLIQSDVNIKADVSIRNSKTIIRYIENGISKAQAGQNIISIKTSANYVLSERLNLRLFFDKIITKPVVTSTYPTSNTNAGLSIQFTLAP